ncbi:hypothetical protein GDO78_008735 [Eleutherodactylus coqui]|uniref:Uncharacterized protein n=1 Tax=Eleutherodactylus coqui TaxID=57060 RepID=A0A8J6FEC2_ELECQ|nr:hypothetical protein GDO78_008735 [Eleutherodactylus coqui]
MIQTSPQLAHLLRYANRKIQYTLLHVFCIILSKCSQRHINVNVFLLTSKLIILQFLIVLFCTLIFYI